MAESFIQYQASLIAAINETEHVLVEPSIHTWNAGWQSITISEDELPLVKALFLHSRDFYPHNCGLPDYVTLSLFNNETKLRTLRLDCDGRINDDDFEVSFASENAVSIFRLIERYGVDYPIINYRACRARIDDHERRKNWWEDHKPALIDRYQFFDTDPPEPLIRELKETFEDATLVEMLLETLGCKAKWHEYLGIELVTARILDRYKLELIAEQIELNPIGSAILEGAAKYLVISHTASTNREAWNTISRSQRLKLLKHTITHGHRSNQIDAFFEFGDLRSTIRYLTGFVLSRLLEQAFKRV